MENFQGFMGSIAVGVMKRGLKPDTTIYLIVSTVTHPRLNPTPDPVVKQASGDIGHVTAGIFKVCLASLELRSPHCAERFWLTLFTFYVYVYFVVFYF